jgi:hypothetical protein
MSESHSTTAAAPDKTTNTINNYPNYPFFPHASGQRAKKIRRRMVYFGLRKCRPGSDRQDGAGPGRRAIIAPVVLHPVVEVKVAPGDRVKKDQLWGFRSSSRHTAG